MYLKSIHNIHTINYNILLFISIKNIYYYFLFVLLMDHITRTRLRGPGILVKNNI